MKNILVSTPTTPRRSQRIYAKLPIFTLSLGAVLAQSVLAQTTVTTTADDGPGSLRSALSWVNSNPGTDIITFAIPGVGPCKIQLLSSLPTITEPVVIDGYTQPGTVTNSLVVGENAQLQIELDGSQISSAASGLMVSGGSSTIRGLAINGFIRGAGIMLTSASNRVEGCFIGTDITGTNARPNAFGIRVENAAGNQIGGAAPESRNVIAFSRGQGVRVSGSSLANSILGNSIFGNAQSGIDLTVANGGDGPTPNDPLDADSGPNQLQNFPVLTWVSSFGDQVLVLGSLNSVPSRNYRIELFANSPSGVSGYAQGERFVGSKNVTTDSAGNASFVVSVPPSPGLSLYTATTTDAEGNTSEFFRCVPMVSCGASALGIQPVLSVDNSGPEAIVHWSGSGFVLQSADQLAGPWADLTTGVVAGGANIEAHLPFSGPQQFYRLREILPCADPAAAAELIRTNRALPGDLDNPSVPEPTLTWFDSSTLLGRSAPAQLAWSFHLGGDRPVDVIVSADGRRVLDVVLNGPETPFTHLTTPRFRLDEVTGVPRFVSFNPPLVLPAATTANPVSVANAFFTTFPWMFGTLNPAQQLLLDRTDTDLTGGKHLVFQQIYAGMPVWGCELRVHLDSNLGITSISGRYFRDPDVELTPSISQSEAFTSAMQHWVQANGSDQLLPGETINQEGLVVLPARLIDAAAQNDIVWWFRFPDADRFVSATTGTNITAYSRRHHLRQVFDANNDYWAPLGQADLQLNDSVIVTQNSLDPETRSADEAMSKVQSFWFGNFGWNSWDNANGPMIAVVDANFDNPFTTKVEGPKAAWNGVWTAYSRNFATASAKDVVAHEFTHALLGKRVNFAYAFESGALDESFSDVFGKLTIPAPLRWVLGSALSPPARRDLAQPTVDNYANLVILPNTEQGDYGGVHDNAGIGNRAAVLVSDGDSSTVHPGIGRPQLARLYWDTLYRLSPWSTYVDLVANAPQVAQDLGLAARMSTTEGRGAPQVPDPDMPLSFLPFRAFGVATDKIEVLWAFRQVGLDLQLQSGWFGVPGNATTDHVFFNVPDPNCQNKVVTDVTVLLYHRPRPGDSASSLSKDGTGFLGSMKLSLGEVSKAFGPVTATITEHHLGTNNREVHVRVTTDNYSDVAVDVILELGGICGLPLKTTARTPNVVHWFDFFLGRKYDDTIYGCTGNGALPANCTITDITLFLLDENQRLVGPGVRWNDGPAIYRGTGAEISEQPAGGRDLRVKVHSWHDSGQAVRYCLFYTYTTIGDTSPPLPPFRFCDGGDIYGGFGEGYIQDP
jgi:Zn-dependent metalloprotease